MEREDYIFGMRAVIEAIRAGKNIDKILMKREMRGENVAELTELAKIYGILIRRVPEEKLNRITRKNHQGVIALLSPISFHNLDNILPELYENGKTPFCLVLDGITDIRNFGAIVRTADCAGVDFIVLTESGSVSITSDAVKTSAGALFYLPVCREANAASAIRKLKENGYTVTGASEKATMNYTEGDYKVPTAIVMGAEDKGISNEALKLCDNLAAIPLMGEIGSLNVSVAAGIMMYEVVRQRKEK